MKELIIAAVFYTILALLMIIRLVKGPRAADRAVACDCIDILATTVLILYSVYSGRGIYLDIALVVAILGTIGTMLIARYLEGRL